MRDRLPPPLEWPDRLEGDMLERAARPRVWTTTRHAQAASAIHARIAREPARHQRLALAVGTCAALAVAGSWAYTARPSAPSAPAPTAERAATPSGRRFEVFTSDDLGTLETPPGTDVRLREQPQERQLVIDAGLLRARIEHQDPARPVVVVTPHLRVVVVGTRFDVEVDPALTRIHLLEGRVRVERGVSAVVLEPGESIRSDDARLSEPPPSPALVPSAAATAPAPRRRPRAAAVPDCGAVQSVAPRRACFERLARGTDLAAQDALFSLGLMAGEMGAPPEEALRWWRAYEARFPTGVLGPEVALSILGTLLHERRLGEAMAAATSFERRFPSDPRAGEVALAHAALLCAQPTRRHEGRSLLGALMRRPEPALRKMALTARGRCADDAEPWTVPWDTLIPATAGVGPPPGD